MRGVFVGIFFLFNICWAQTDLFQTNLFQARTKIDSLLNLREYDKIEALYKSEIGKDSTNKQLLFRFAKFYQRLAKHSKAVNCFSEYIKLDSTNSQIFYLKGISESALDLIEDSYVDFNKAYALDTNFIEALILKAKNAASLQKYFDAENSYLKLIKNDSTNSIFFKELSEIQFNLKKDSSAFLNLKRSYQLNPRNKKVVKNIFKYFLIKNEKDSALKYINKGLVHYPKDIFFNEQKGLILFLQRKYEKAISSYFRAMSYGNKSFQLYYHLGVSHLQLLNDKKKVKKIGRSELAETALIFLKTAFNINENDPLVNLYLGIGFSEINKVDSAIYYFRNSAENMIPAYIDRAYLEIGKANLKLKNYIEAIKNFRLAENYNKANKNIKYYLATAYDNWYADASVPYKMYGIVLKNSKDFSPEIINYCTERRKILRQKMHFQNGSKKYKYLKNKYSH